MLFFSILASFATAVAAISINVGDRYDSSLDVSSIANGVTYERDLTLARAAAIKERQDSNEDSTIVHIGASSATGGESYDASISTRSPTLENLNFDNHVYIGTKAFEFIGKIEQATLYAEIRGEVRIRLIATALIGEAKGSLQDGIKITFSTVGVSGDLRFFAKDDWMWIDYDVIENGERYKDQDRLISLNSSEQDDDSGR